MSKVIQSVKDLLLALTSKYGVDLVGPNFEDTPNRVSKAYDEILGGLKDTDNKIKNVLNTAFPSEGYSGIIFCSSIKTFSLCPHHLLPVEYEISIGYVPSSEGKVLGASKLPRIAEILSKRPVLQEGLTNDIANALSFVNPLGVAVVVSGVHYCMRMRGVRQQSTFETSVMTGSFKEHDSTRNEFFELLKVSKMGKN